MGLSRCGIYLEGADQATAERCSERLGLIAPAAVSIGIASDQAEISDDLIGVTARNGWGVLFADSGPFLDGQVFEQLRTLSMERDIFCWLTQSASAGLWFEFHRKGERIRKWLEVEGVVEANEGAPLAIEPGDFFDSTQDRRGRDEWSLVALAGTLTGISEDLQFDMPFAVFEMTPRASSRR